MFAKNGRPAKSIRVALGALIIQETSKTSDEETARAIAEGPYLRHFIGLKTYRVKSHEAFAGFVKQRKPSKKAIRKRVQLRYLRRNLRATDGLLAERIELSEKQQAKPEVMRKDHEQRRVMFSPTSFAPPIESRASRSRTSAPSCAGRRARCAISS